jgi:hypothetical protein
MNTKIKNYEIKQHSTFYETIRLLNTNRSPKDITGWLIYGGVHHFYNTSIYTPFVITIPDATNGIFDIKIASADTSLLISSYSGNSGNYIYDIAAKLPDNTVLRLQSGGIVVSAGITNTALPGFPPINDDDTIFIDGGVI